MVQNLLIKRGFSSAYKLRFGIVGGGPSGFYSAKHLLKNFPNCEVDIFEALPMPFGLLRYGVAPDHVNIKNAMEDLREIRNNQNMRYFGNVQIGQDLTIKELEPYYSAIILAFGAQDEKKLNLENEDFQNFHGKLKFLIIINYHHVQKYYICQYTFITPEFHVFTQQNKQINDLCRYNGHPDYLNYNFSLENVKNISIIGNGNVAIDIARVINKQNMNQTDINLKAMNLFASNKIQNIQIFGRRGIVQSAFSLKELRELWKLDLFNFYLVKNDLDRDLNSNCQLEMNDLQQSNRQESRANKRKYEFMKSKCQIIENDDELKNILFSKKSDKKNLIFRYLLSPSKINLFNNHIQSVVFDQNELQVYLNKFNYLPERIELQDYLR